MRNLSSSLKIYIALIITLAVLAASNVFLPQAVPLSEQELSASKPMLALINAAIMLILYGGLGLLGLKLGQRLGFSELWDERVSNAQRFVIAALIGVCLGLFLILADAIFSRGKNLVSTFPALALKLKALQVLHANRVQSCLRLRVYSPLQV